MRIAVTGSSILVLAITKGQTISVMVLEPLDLHLLLWMKSGMDLNLSTPIKVVPILLQAMR
jgi:hypothetical protein